MSPGRWASVSCIHGCRWLGSPKSSGGRGVSDIAGERQLGARSYVQQRDYSTLHYGRAWQGAPSRVLEDWGYHRGVPFHFIWLDT